MRLIDLHNEFMFHIQVKGNTPRTLKSYNDNNKRFIAYLESEFQVTELDEVKTLHIKQYGMQLVKKGRKEIYINSIYKRIRSFFNYCIDEGYKLYL